MPTHPNPKDRMATDLTLTQGSSNPTANRSTDATAVDFPSVNTKIGIYEIREQLGRGAMGVVYRCYDPSLKREVAVKLLSPGYNPTEFDLNRFRGEAEIASNLIHPNIIQIITIDKHQLQPYIVMEYVDGGTLDQKIQNTPQPPRYAAETVEIVARAIAFAHQREVIHRDLKPANILISKTGTIKITDFGLAKQLDMTMVRSQTGDILGTPGYMSPEQASGLTKEIGKPTDIYALGAILYEMLTGKPPFRGVTLLETLEQIRTAEPASPSRLVPRLHRDLSTICLTCLHKNPARRYPTAEALANDLRNWLDGQPITARPVASWEQIWRSIKRRPTQAVIVLATIMMIVLCTIIGIVIRERNHSNSIAKQQEEAKFQQERLNQQIQEQEKRSKALAENSLNTMNEIIKKLTTDEKLSRIGGLESLHEVLTKHNLELLEDPDKAEVFDATKLIETQIRLAELIQKSGNHSKAQKIYQEAKERLQQMPESKQKEKDVQRRLAKINMDLGKSLAELGSYDVAEKCYLEAQLLLHSLVQEEQNNFEYKKLLAEVWHRKAECFNQSKNKPLKDILEAYDTSIELRKKLPTSGPDEKVRSYKRDLARGYGYRGDIYLDNCQYSLADADYWSSHKLREELAIPDPSNNQANREFQFQFARSYANLGNFQTRVRAFDTALMFHKQALAIQEKIVKEDSLTVEYRDDLGNTHVRMMELYILKAANNNFKEYQETIEKLLQEANKIYSKQKIDWDNQTFSYRSGDLFTRFFTCYLHIQQQKSDSLKVDLVSIEEQLKKLIAVRKDPRDHFLFAQVNACLYSQTKTEEDLKQSLNSLKEAIGLRYRYLHPEDLRQHPVFQVLVENEKTKTEWEELMKEYQSYFEIRSQAAK